MLSSHADDAAKMLNTGNDAEAVAAYGLSKDSDLSGDITSMIARHEK